MTENIIEGKWKKSATECHWQAVGHRVVQHWPAGRHRVTHGGSQDTTIPAAGQSNWSSDKTNHLADS